MSLGRSMVGHASAPGKLVLFGEYAVLHGAPAVVMAVRRRARVDWQAAPDWQVRAVQLGVQGRFVLRGQDGRVHPQWLDDAGTPMGLSLFETVLGALAERPMIDAGPCALSLDTGAFFEAGTKMGLGSSAALTVALGGFFGAQISSTWLARLVQAHRLFQSGRGSGIDVAASLYGGVLRARLGGPNRMPQVVPTHLPAGVECLAVWTGKGASTPAFLGAIEAFAERAPGRFDACMASLSHIAEAGVAALPVADFQVFRETLQAYGSALSELGDEAGVDIVSAPHRQVGALVCRSGAVYKPSGAGGGDLGIAVCRDLDVAAAVRQDLDRAGLMSFTVQPDAAGLRVA